MAIIGSDLPNTIATGLSDFWKIFFRDFNAINEMGRGLENTYGQIYLDLMNKVLNISLEDTPLYSKLYWKSLELNESEEIFLNFGAPGDNRWVFPLKDNVIDFNLIYNKIYLPESSFEKNIDFNIYTDPKSKEFLKSLNPRIDIEQNYLGFAFALFDEPLPGFAIRNEPHALLIRLYDPTINFTGGITGPVRPDHYIKVYSSASDINTFKIKSVSKHYVDVYVRNQFPSELLNEVLIYSIGSDPLNPINKVPKRTGGELQTIETTAKILSAWCPNVYYDELALYTNFGYLIQQKGISTEQYRALLQGVYSLYMTGATLQNVEAALNLIMGYPVIRVDDEIIVSFLKKLEHWIITTDQNTYLFPPETPFKPEVILACQTINSHIRSNKFNLLVATENTDLEQAINPVDTNDFIKELTPIRTSITGEISTLGGEGFLHDINIQFIYPETDLYHGFAPVVRTGDTLRIINNLFGNDGFYTIAEIIGPNDIRISPNIAAADINVEYEIFQSRSIFDIFIQENIIFTNQTLDFYRNAIYSHENGETRNVPTGLFRSITASFLNNVNPGDILIIYGSTNEGVYEVDEVLNNTEILIKITEWIWETPLIGPFEQIFAVYPAISLINISIGNNAPAGPGSTEAYTNKLAAEEMNVIYDKIIYLDTSTFFPLTDTFHVTDYINDPDWWDNILIPDSLMPLTSTLRRISSPFSYLNFINEPDSKIFIGDLGFTIGTNENSEWNVIYDDINTPGAIAVIGDICLVYLPNPPSIMFNRVKRIINNNEIELFKPISVTEHPQNNPLNLPEYLIPGKIDPKEPCLLSGHRHNNAWHALNKILKYGIFLVSWDLDSSNFNDNKEQLRQIIYGGKPSHLMTYWQLDEQFSDTVYMYDENLDVIVIFDFGILSPDIYDWLWQQINIGGTWNLGDSFQINAPWMTPISIGMIDPDIDFDVPSPTPPFDPITVFGEYPLEFQTIAPIIKILSDLYDWYWTQIIVGPGWSVGDTFQINAPWPTYMRVGMIDPTISFIDEQYGELPLEIRTI